MFRLMKFRRKSGWAGALLVEPSATGRPTAVAGTFGCGRANLVRELSEAFTSTLVVLL